MKLVIYRYVTQNRVSEQAGVSMARGKDMSLQDRPVTEKRGRGRPRKPDAMTNAQRQAAFRARHRTAGESVTVTKKRHDELVLECERLREELAQARRAVAKHRRHEAGDGVLRAASAVLVQPVPDTTELDEKRLVVTLGVREHFSLDRLAAHHGLTKRAVIERLLWWADDSVVRSLGDDDAAFNRYLNRVTKNTK
jgi:hypothetical protein